LSGALDLLQGKEIDLTIEGATPAKSEEKEEFQYLYELSLKISTDKQFTAQDEANIRVYLESIADKLKLSQDDKQMSVSLTTNEPGRAITKALKHGSIKEVSLINLRDDKNVASVFDGSAGSTSGSAPKSESKDSTSDPFSGSTISAGTLDEEYETVPESDPKDVGFVAVSIGEGLNQIFKDLGADRVIAGGQTMNPSTEDILSAVEQVNAPVVFVLPNNKNIILAANQARDLCKDKKVIVLPTKTIPQGISALINYIPDQTPEDNESNLLEELKYVASGEITYAVRDTTIDDKEIRQGDYMGIGDAGILAVDKEIESVMIKMLGEMITEDSAIITMYYGADVKKRDAKKIAAKVLETYPNIEVELQKGDQPVYFYIVSVE
ncbi:MAG: DAK2 domain-containing protein, partial [Lachnospiraceae bacterium]|nr:DAK2 domain-containing protein [Lachnospiraceae bacterium]